MDPEGLLTINAINAKDNEDKVHIRCRAFTKNKKCCKAFVDIDPSKRLQAYCSAHLGHSVKANIRICDGVSSQGPSCLKRVRRSASSPAFCMYHQQQTSALVVCFGSTATGVRCTTVIEWEDPSFQFCGIPADQATTFKSSISGLPNEILNIVIDQLRPIDLVALAFLNRSCRDAAKLAAPEKPLLRYPPQDSCISTATGQRR